MESVSNIEHNNISCQSDAYTERYFKQKGWKHPVTRVTGIRAISELDRYLSWMFDGLLFAMDYKDSLFEYHNITDKEELQTKREYLLCAIVDTLPFFDLPYFGEISDYILENNDKDMAEEFCNIETLVVGIAGLCVADWQHGVLRLEKITGSLFLLMSHIFEIKRLVLHVEILDLSKNSSGHNEYFVREATKMALKNGWIKSPAGIESYKGWAMLFDSLKSKPISTSPISDSNSLHDAIEQKVKTTKTHIRPMHRREPFTTVSNIPYPALYRFLTGYIVTKGSHTGKHALDGNAIGLIQFKDSVERADYTEIFKHCLVAKMKLVISKLSQYYFEDTKRYRETAASTTDIAIEDINKFSNTDKKFHKGLLNVLTRAS